LSPSITLFTVKGAATSPEIQSILVRHSQGAEFKITSSRTDSDLFRFSITSEKNSSEHVVTLLFDSDEMVKIGKRFVSSRCELTTSLGSVISFDCAARLERD